MKKTVLRWDFDCLSFDQAAKIVSALFPSLKGGTQLWRGTWELFQEFIRTDSLIETGYKSIY